MEFKEEKGVGLCGACLSGCSECFSSCLEKGGMKATGKKHPNAQYQPSGRARRTFDIPELNETPIPGQVFEFAQSGTPYDFSVHPTFTAEAVTKQPTSEGRRSHHRTPEREPDVSSQYSTLDRPRSCQENIEIEQIGLHFQKKSKSLDEHHSDTLQIPMPVRVESIQFSTESQGADVGPPMLQFSLHNDIQCHTLTVHIQSATNLSQKSSDEGPCSSFVVVHLLPNKGEVHSTEVMPKMRNPVYNVVFKFGLLLSFNEITLVFKVFHRHTFMKRELIGVVTCPLRDADFSGNQINMEIMQGEQCDSMDVLFRGDILLSLCYNPSHSLGGVILKVTNLHRRGLPPDPYIKVYLLHGGKRVSKWKSSIKKHTLIPVFNESFTFDISTLEVNNLSLQVFVMDYDRFKPNEIIGNVIIGPDSPNSSDSDHWNEIVTMPGQQVSHWHTLSSPKELTKQQGKRSIKELTRKRSMSL